MMTVIMVNKSSGRKENNIPNVNADESKSSGTGIGALTEIRKKIDTRGIGKEGHHH